MQRRTVAEYADRWKTLQGTLRQFREEMFVSSVIARIFFATGAIIAYYLLFFFLVEQLQLPEVVGEPKKILSQSILHAMGVVGLLMLAAALGVRIVSDNVAYLGRWVST